MPVPPIKTIRSIFIAVLAATAFPAAADDCLPSLAGERAPLKPAETGFPITGDEAADARLRQLAEERGYRPQARLADEADLAFPWSVHRCLLPSWKRLRAAAERAGFKLSIVSGYRSLEKQRQIILSKLAQLHVTPEQIADGRADDKIDGVLDFSAMPGYSRHHSGFTIDIQNDLDGLSAFGESAAYRWLAENNFESARQFGFVPSYPEEMPGQGPVPEPWEFIWVGDTAHLAGTETAIGDSDELLKSARRILLALEKGDRAAPAARAVDRADAESAVKTLPGGG